MLVLSIFLTLARFIFAQYPEGSSNYVQQQSKGKNDLEEAIQSHPDVINMYFPDRKEENAYQKYRESYPDPEDYIISFLVNPCGVNSTRNDIDKTVPLSYDCCMNRYGRGEYGFLKYHQSHRNGEVPMTTVEAARKRLLATPDEVMHNMILVDEYGTKIPYEESRRADDYMLVDESCKGLREPHPSCLRGRLRAVANSLVPTCWDHNQTVDSTLSCYTPDGQLSPYCMQVSYAQNAFIFVCEGDFADDNRCGTFIEIHMPNGSPYEDEEVTLADTKITTSFTNGMITTTIPLTYKGNKRRVLCAYTEFMIRIGSVVRITENSSSCCCPPSYSKMSKVGSFFCPRKPWTKGGPFADRVDNLSELLQRDQDQTKYPYCHSTKEEEDTLMCSRKIDNMIEQDEYLEQSQFYTSPCTQEDLQGYYEEPCKYGDSFNACGTASGIKCYGEDSVHKFGGESGKVTLLPSKSSDLYGVTFNDGRTTYFFPKHHLELQTPNSNYELWLVQRNRFEKILKKRKGFRVMSPKCTFDPVNDRYFPFAILDKNGDTVPVFSEYGGQVFDI